MRHNDDAFATMLLTLALTANKDELVKPLSAIEYSQLTARVKNTSVKRVAALMSMDVTGIMRALDVEEAEAYRLGMLLSRTMPLSYAMERFYEKCVEFLTLFDDEYPYKLRARLNDKAPPAMYFCGDINLLKTPLVGILGISGVKLDSQSVQGLRALVGALVDEGFGIVTSSEPGACRVAEMEAFARGGKVICVTAGDMLARANEFEYMDAIAAKQALLLSLIHPEAPYTLAHAAQRNKSVFALALAAFVVTTDARRGETEAIRQKYCDWVYAFNIKKPEGNQLLISRGATPVYDAEKLPIKQYAANWRNAQAEQLSFF